MKEKKLLNLIIENRHAIIANMQRTFMDFWNSTENGIVGTGICFDIAYNLINELYSILAQNYKQDADFGMHIYDNQEHAYTVIYCSKEIYKIDYPCEEYEFKILNEFKSCDWILREGYIFEPKKIIIEAVERKKYFRFDKTGLKYLKYGKCEECIFR